MIVSPVSPVNRWKRVQVQTARLVTGWWRLTASRLVRDGTTARAGLARSATELTATRQLHVSTTLTVTRMPSVCRLPRARWLRCRYGGASRYSKLWAWIVAQIRDDYDDLVWYGCQLKLDTANCYAYAIRDILVRVEQNWLSHRQYSHLRQLSMQVA